MTDIDDPDDCPEPWRSEIERLRHQCEKLAAAALSNGEDLLRHENEVERLRKALSDLVMLERLTWLDSRDKPRRYAVMQNGRALAEALDKAREVLDATAEGDVRDD